MLAIISPVREWFVASRPWSLTASAIPVCLGMSLALYHGQTNWLLFVVTLLAGIFLQVGTNYFNTYGDYVSSVDTVDSALTCPQLVKSMTTPKKMYIAGVLSFALVIFLLGVLVWQAGSILLVYATLGFAGGYLYTNGKFPYKYHALGPVLVFFLMGPLMVCPTYYILTGSNAFTPFLASLSIGCLVTGIMHGNDIRDIEHDKNAGIRTVALLLGVQKALHLFIALYIGAYVVLLTGVLFGLLPILALLPILLLPSMYKALVPLFSCKQPVDFLEGWAAKTHLQFGGLLIIGIVITVLLQRFWV